MMTWQQIYEILHSRTQKERNGTALAFSKRYSDFFEIETIVVGDFENDTTDGYPYIVMDDD